MKKGVCEAVGTFVLVLFGCGTAVVTGGNIVATALAFGLSIVAMAYTIGKVSGCHVNPAVSFAMFMDGKMKLTEFINYVIFQFIGAFGGSAVLAILVKCGALGDADSLSDCSMGANGFGNLNFFGALLVEVILTFVFVLVIFGVTESKSEDIKRNAGLFIGAALTFVHIFGINLTGTSVNPARSFSAAVFAIGNSDWKSISQLWVFIVGPLVGAVLATMFNRAFIKNAD